jgi:hypothetical protein
MSDGDRSALGKRTRAEAVGSEPFSQLTHEERSLPVVPQEESDDDDVGPMPLPLNDNGTQALKKKRKGTYYDGSRCCMTLEIQNPILSLASRTIVSGSSSGCGPVSKKFHAPRHDKLLCGYQVSSVTRYATGILWSLAVIGQSS